MATITNVKINHGSGRPRTNPDRHPITSVEVTLQLTPVEAACLPTQAGLRKFFGPAKEYYSQVYGRAGSGGGELTILYRIADQPHGSKDAKLVPRLAKTHIEKKLKQERRRRQSKSGGK